MPIINKDTFEQRKKSLNLTNKAISEMAEVTETTVGKIKKDNQNLQAHTVTKIAKVLNLTTEQLISPPEASSQKKWFDRYGECCLSGASILYNVPEKWIIEHAGLFFSILAEQSLAERGKKAQQCLSDLNALDDKLFLRDNYFDPDTARDPYLEAIHEELEAIEKKDLSGPRDESRDQNAHFINFLFENSGVEIFDAKKWDADTQTNVELGADLEYLDYYLEVPNDAISKLLPEYSDSDQLNARDIIEKNYLLSKIPTRLRSKDRVDDLVKWVFQWKENKINEFLPEHSNKTLNDRRILAKARLREDNSINYIEHYEQMQPTKPDALADYIIKNHEKEVLERKNKSVDLEENSDA